MRCVGCCGKQRGGGGGGWPIVERCTQVTAAPVGAFTARRDGARRWRDGAENGGQRAEEGLKRGYYASRAAGGCLVQASSLAGRGVAGSECLPKTRLAAAVVVPSAVQQAHQASTVLYH
jgi:hypothetical protein